MPRIVPVPYQKLVRVLEAEGFALVRERGDHMIFSKPGGWFPAMTLYLFSSSKTRFEQPKSAEKDIFGTSRSHVMCKV
jgi:hypothetical protein